MKRHSKISVALLLVILLITSMAIAFDSAASKSQDSSTTNTFAHTVSGSNRIILVGCMTTNGTITGVTYNGVALTQVIDNTTGGTTFNHMYLFYLIAPATGTNNVIVTSSGSGSVYAASSSYTGVAQTSPIDGTSATTTTTAGTFSKSVTTTIANDWIIGYVGVGNYGVGPASFPAAGSGTTRRATDPGTGSWYSIFDGNGAVSAGVNSLNYDTTGYTSAVFGINMVGIKPFSTAVNSGFLMFM